MIFAWFQCVLAFGLNWTRYTCFWLKPSFVSIFSNPAQRSLREKPRGWRWERLREALLCLKRGQGQDGATSSSNPPSPPYLYHAVFMESIPPQHAGGLWLFDIEPSHFFLSATRINSLRRSNLRYCGKRILPTLRGIFLLRRQQ